ncbi:MAG: hypothetical protein QOE09_2595 [Ilumatobacteraceae bacterium]
MHQLAWIRLMVARHPWIYWLTIAAVASLVAVGAQRVVAGVDAQRRSWGRQQSVWIATVGIEPGQAIAADRNEVPAAVVPIDAAVHVDAGAVARQHIGAGEIVTNADLTATGVAGLIPAEWSAFAVPESVEHFTTGDHVGVYTGDRLLAPGLVVAAGTSELMVAVPDASAPALAAALLADAVTLALTPSP